VAIDSEHVGYSLCCPNDTFNKARARQIAAARAAAPRAKGLPDVNHRPAVEAAIAKMRERMAKYYAKQTVSDK
jgi:hypothetical protein